ncbi:hypothetical protein CAPTEDRAFT_186172 [Capitella teleta]|uniref:Mediator of RNA polymerase II transcription subunit 26 n=1 Tax=Capitella teleta TaxID=283909 RepID=R7UIK1_CAPTE|nr:hypothetical protein CAPTEDRAFT_186172 [Capitella teleta]|eukprot:ELU03618.1 hypothetical protein CAPTEDRAFT_186172 [Capitella teleta]
MQCTPQDLKERLLKAVDQDHNVVNMAEVLDVFSFLERHTISREILEQTRMGLTVNNIRRQTSNKDLAKRARALLRAWQKLLPSTQPTVNGDAHNTGNGSVLHRNVNSLVNSAESKPNSPVSRPGTPGLSHRRPGTPASSSTHAANTPLSSFHKSRLSPKSAIATGVSSPVLSQPSPSASSSPHLTSSTPHAANACISRSSTPTEALSKKNVANKRKRRVDSPLAEGREVKHNNYPKNTSCDNDAESGGIKLTIKHDRMNGLVSHTDIFKNGASSSTDEAHPPPFKRTVSSSSLKLEEAHELRGTPGPSLERVQSASALAMASRTPKVKTTMQLMKELHESGVKLRSSETITKIALNQIQKEDDSDQMSVVPAGAKPRPRKKPAMLPPTPSHRTLSQTKEERIQKFLQTSISAGSDADLNALLHLDPPLELDASQSQADVKRCHEERFADLERRELNSAEPCEDDELAVEVERPADEKQRFLDDPWSFLPALDLNTIDFEDDQYYIADEDVQERSTVTPNMVSRLTESNWAGVNGQFDHEDRWHDWVAAYSLPSFQGQMLHLLPYVDLEESQRSNDSEVKGEEDEGGGEVGADGVL